MSASTAAMPSSTSVYTTRGFWERLWRLSGINFVVFVIIAYVIYGYQPQVGQVRIRSLETELTNFGPSSALRLRDVTHCVRHGVDPPKKS